MKTYLTLDHIKEPVEEPLYRAHLIPFERMMLLKGRRFVGWWDIDEGWVGLLDARAALIDNKRAPFCAEAQETLNKFFKKNYQVLRFSTWMGFRNYCENL